jgi:hypothetical protein
MKTFLISLLALTACLRASAQVTVDLGLDQEQFLPNEAVKLAVKITNRSGQPVHLGADANWLTFSVESDDNFVVIKNAEVPVLGEFDVESSERATKKVDLQPYFSMGRPGRYKVTATVRIKAWSLAINSAPKHFDVINGAELWSQEFGVMVATNTLPEPRKYSLVEANYLREQLRLYVQVSSGDGAHVFRVAALGPLVSFSAPEAQVDRVSNLHVLWQSGAQSFNSMIVSPDGAVVLRDMYDNFNSRPRLTVNTSGEVVVQGGVRRAKPSDLPVVKLPDALAPPPAKPEKK